MFHSKFTDLVRTISRGSTEYVNVIDGIPTRRRNERRPHEERTPPRGLYMYHMAIKGRAFPVSSGCQSAKHVIFSPFKRHVRWSTLN